MLTSESEVILTIIVSTILLLLFSGGIIYFLFKYQRKRYSHQREVFELKESFNKILLNSKIQIQEQTLDHISKELHSNIGQLASLININLSGLLHNSNDKESILETKALAKVLMSELKSISTALNTDYIMKIGFEKALNFELNRVSKIMKYPVNFKVTGSSFSLGPEKEIILFRLCQEVINNIIKYAEASKIDVDLMYNNDSIKLIIEDNGVGFDMDLVQKNRDKNSSTGLLNIEKRANIINAKMNVLSKLNIGTKVSLFISR